MFLPNKYTRWYMQIVGRATSRKLKGYTEKHHIIPKSLGGSNAKDNIVSLTAREHFLCHWLLIKILTGKQKQKMSFALWTMIREAPKHQRHLTSAQYETARKHFSEVQTKRPKSKATRAKLSASLSGMKRPWAYANIKNRNVPKKTWKVRHPDGHTEVIHGLTQFCKEHGLHQGNLSHYGKTKGYQASEVAD